MSSNKVDIILPVYNTKDFIIQTLKSIIKQTYRNWRILIVDDASNDGTTELIKFFLNRNLCKKKFLFIKNKKNRGQAFCRNLALKYSKSKFIAFIDSDDMWTNNKLSKQIKFMLSKGYNFTYTDYKSIKNDKIKKIITPLFFNYKNFTKNTSLATSTMIIKRNFLNKIFFPKLRRCEDYYFKCKILNKIRAYRCRGFYTFYRLRNNSLQSDRLKVLLALWNINKRYNKMNFSDNLFSIFFIIYNSLKKYALR